MRKQGPDKDGLTWKVRKGKVWDDLVDVIKSGVKDVRADHSEPRIDIVLVHQKKKEPKVAKKGRRADGGGRADEIDLKMDALQGKIDRLQKQIEQVEKMYREKKKGGNQSPHSAPSTKSTIHMADIVDIPSVPESRSPSIPDGSFRMSEDSVLSNAKEEDEQVEETVRKASNRLSLSQGGGYQAKKSVEEIKIPEKGPEWESTGENCEKARETQPEELEDGPDGTAKRKVVVCSRFPEKDLLGCKECSTEISPEKQIVEERVIDDELMDEIRMREAEKAAKEYDAMRAREEEELAKKKNKEKRDTVRHESAVGWTKEDEVRKHEAIKTPKNGHKQKKDSERELKEEHFREESGTIDLGEEKNKTVRYSFNVAQKEEEVVLSTDDFMANKDSEKKTVYYVSSGAGFPSALERHYSSISSGEDRAGKEGRRRRGRARRSEDSSESDLDGVYGIRRAVAPNDSIELHKSSKSWCRKGKGKGRKVARYDCYYSLTEGRRPGTPPNHCLDVDPRSSGDPPVGYAARKSKSLVSVFKSEGSEKTYTVKLNLSGINLSAELKKALLDELKRSWEECIRKLAIVQAKFNK